MGQVFFALRVLPYFVCLLGCSRHGRARNTYRATRPTADCLFPEPHRSHPRRCTRRRRALSGQLEDRLETWYVTESLLGSERSPVPLSYLRAVFILSPSPKVLPLRTPWTPDLLSLVHFRIESLQRDFLESLVGAGIRNLNNPGLDWSDNGSVSIGPQRKPTSDNTNLGKAWTPKFFMAPRFLSPISLSLIRYLPLSYHPSLSLNCFDRITPRNNSPSSCFIPSQSSPPRSHIPRT